MIHRSAFILPTAIRAAANALAVQIGVDPDGLLNTLSVPLVPSAGAGDAEPTHFACCALLTPAQTATLVAASGQFPGALWWRWNELPPDEGQLVACHDSQHLGETWSWPQCLNAASAKHRVESRVA